MGPPTLLPKHAKLMGVISSAERASDRGPLAISSFSYRRPLRCFGIVIIDAHCALQLPYSIFSTNKQTDSSQTGLTLLVYGHICHLLISRQRHGRNNGEAGAQGLVLPLFPSHQKPGREQDEAVLPILLHSRHWKPRRRYVRSLKQYK